MRLFRRFKRHSKNFVRARFTKRWIVGVVILFICFLTGFIVERTIEGVAVKLAERKLKAWRDRTGASLEWQTIEASFGAIDIVGVKFGQAQVVVVDRVTAKMDLNPFSGSFLRPSRLVVGHLYVKTEVPRQERLRWLEEFVRSLRSKSGDARPNSKLPGLIPPEIRLEAGKIVLAGADDEHVRVTGLEATALTGERKVNWRARSITIKPYLEENFIEGRVVFIDPANPKITLRSRPFFTGRPTWSVECSYGRDSQQAACEVDATSLPQSVIGTLQRHLGTSFSPGVLGTVTVAKSGPAWRATFDGDISRIIVEHRALSVDSIGPFDLGTRFAVDIDPKRRAVRASGMKVALPVGKSHKRSVGLDIDVDLSEVAHGEHKFLQGKVQTRMQQARCDDVLRSLPPGIAPDLEGFELSGELSGDVSLRLDDQRADLTWGKMNIACDTIKMPKMYTADYLNGSFILERSLGKDRVIQIPVDPSRPTYAPLKNIPSHVVAAFIASEDAGFWRHNGIEPAAIEQALERNAREGRVAVGGSTITMQTVKNLFLSRDKTLARKAQEIFLAWHLERLIGKKRILEIYFNIVEFGPDLYGIGAAAQRFFGVTIDKLTWKQGAYLASLLPAPIPRYQYFCRGRLSPNYSELVSGLLARILALGRMSALDHAQAVGQSINFVSAQQDLACLEMSDVSTSSHAAEESELD